MCAQGLLYSPFHMWLNSIVSTIVSMGSGNGASNEDSLSFTLPTFALPWV